MNGDKTGKRSDENKTYTGFRNPAGSYYYSNHKEMCEIVQN